MTPSFSSAEGLDFRVILGVPLLQFLPWLAAVLIVTWAGYPGVVCVTPLAWLIAARVGIVCIRRTTSTQPARRLLEAALAGVWFGLLEGLLFIVIIQRLGSVQPGEQASAAMLSVLMVVFGMLVGAGMSLFTAFLADRRQQAASLVEEG